MTSHSSPSPPFLLVSPREPSGVSWMINCLLELGIRVDLQPTVDQIFGTGRQPASAMWMPEPCGQWRLHPRASALQKWLPILSRSETLQFRPIPPVLHVQSLPRQDEPRGPVILFVRDLRDALHSLYQRQQPELSWPEFVDWPHPETLLDAIDHWRLFTESWLGQPNVLVGRFEDYKADATGLLKRVLQYLKRDFSPEEIAHAVDNSSYAAAKAAEERYRERHPHDHQIANRAGQVGEWESLPDLRPMIHQMERRAGRLLTRLGYHVNRSDDTIDSWDALAISRQLSEFSNIDLPRSILESIPAELPQPMLQRLRQFCEQLSAARLTQARLEAEESRRLLRSLKEFSICHAPTATALLHTLAQSLNEGSAFHLARIRALLLSRRPSTAE